MCVGDITQERDEVSLGQRALKSSSVMRSSLTPGFVLFTASKCSVYYIKFCGLYKASRHGAKNMLIGDASKVIGGIKI